MNNQDVFDLNMNAQDPIKLAHSNSYIKGQKIFSFPAHNLAKLLKNGDTHLVFISDNIDNHQLLIQGKKKVGGYEIIVLDSSGRITTQFLKHSSLALQLPLILLQTFTNYRIHKLRVSTL